MSDGLPGVLLDVDGTLVDSNYLHTMAWSRGFRDIGEWAPAHTIHRLVGMGADHLVPELFGSARDGAEEAWRRRYDELVDEARPFPGSADLVRRLRSLGFGVVLATSSPTDLLERSIDLLGIANDLTASTSSDDVEESKPEPAVFEAAIRAGGLDRERTLAVGDSIWDVQAARAAGIGCIGLETGGFSRHELTEEGALAVYRNAEELLEQVLTSPIGALVPR
jgi:HAD superfamily hydrolase (TIGR01509 family)